MKNLVRMGNPLLRLVAKPLSREEILSPATKELVQEMEAAMIHYGGVGIAAPQIGVSQSIAMLEIKHSNPRYNLDESYPLTVFINPTITVLDPTPQGYWEGCLSVPGLRGYVERPSKIRVDFFNLNAESVSIEAEGFLAVVFQHELDHLFGKLYIDHIKDTSLLSYNEEFEQFIKPNVDKSLED